MLAQPLTSCVTLRRFTTLSVSQFPHLKIGILRATLHVSVQQALSVSACGRHSLLPEKEGTSLLTFSVQLPRDEPPPLVSQPGAQSPLPFKSPGEGKHEHKEQLGHLHHLPPFLGWQPGQADCVPVFRELKTPPGGPVPVTGRNKLLQQFDPKRQAAIPFPAECLERHSEEAVMGLREP